MNDDADMPVAIQRSAYVMLELERIDAHEAADRLGIQPEAAVRAAARCAEWMGSSAALRWSVQDQFLQAHAEDMTRTELAERLGVATTTIANRLKKLSLAGPGRTEPSVVWTRRQIEDELQRRHAAGLDISFATMRVEAPALVRAAREYGVWSELLRSLGYEARGYRNWTSDLVVQLIRDAGHARSKELRKTDPVLYQRALDYFGSWAAAVRAAGLTPLRREAHTWTRDELEAELKRLSVDGVAPSRQDASRDHGCPMVNAVDEHFGSWADAVAACGLVFSGKRRQWTERAVLDEIGAMAKRGERLRNPQHTHPGLYKACRRLFGSWSAAVHAAGLETQPVVRRWSTADIIAALQQRSRNGTLARLDIVDSALHLLARRRFGSWRAALDAAGIPTPVRRAYALLRDSRDGDA